MKAVKCCYDFIDPLLTPEFEINIQQARLLAASLAKAGRVPLESILENCHWRHHTTFSQYYLRTLVTKANNLYSLSPIVAAGSVIQPSQKFHKH